MTSRWRRDDPDILSNSFDDLHQYVVRLPKPYWYTTNLGGGISIGTDLGTMLFLDPNLKSRIKENEQFSAYVLGRLGWGEVYLSFETEEEAMLLRLMVEE